MADIKVPLTDLIAPPFYPVHHDLKSGRHAEYWLKGGRGSTKSSFASIEIILGIMRDPEANAMVCRKYGVELYKTVYSQFLKAIKWMGVQRYFKAKLSPLEIQYIPTRQRIMFSGQDDPNKSKSITLTDGYFKYLWIEEPTEFDGIEEIQTVQASIIRGEGGQAFTILTYNPPINARNWINTEVIKPAKGRLVHHSNYLEVPRKWLGENFMTLAEALRDSNERSYRHMYLGEVTGTGGAVFENVVTRPVTDAEIQTFGATYAGLDFGWYPDPLHFVRCAYFPAQKRLVIYDEYRALKQSNYDAFRHLVTEKHLTPAEEVIADSAEPKSIGDMREYGMNCIGATKGPGTVAMSMKWLQSLREIVIDPARCPYAAKEFLEYEYERDRKNEVLAAYPDKENHGIDAVRMALNRIWLTRGA